MAHGGDEGDVRAMVARHAAHDPLPAGSAAIARSETEIGSALIHKDQPARIEMDHLCPPRRARGLIPLAGAQDFF